MFLGEDSLITRVTDENIMFQVSVVSICIVASEFAGIVPNGGIGTFYSTLAEVRLYGMHTS